MYNHLPLFLSLDIKYCEKVYERTGKNLFWSIKKSGEILDKLKARDFNATNLSTYDFSTLYTTLPHNLIKDKLIDLIVLIRDLCTLLTLIIRVVLSVLRGGPKKSAHIFI